MMMNLDLFGLSDELSLFAGDEFLKPVTTFTADVVTSVTSQPRCPVSGHEGRKSELQKLLEGSADYVVSPTPSPLPPPPPKVETPGVVSVPENYLTQLYDADFSWSDTMVDLFDLNGDLATTLPSKLPVSTVGNLATSTGFTTPGGMSSGGLLDLPIGLLDTSSVLGATTNSFSDMSTDVDPFIMLDELACLSPEPVGFTQLRRVVATQKAPVMRPSQQLESNMLEASSMLDSGSSYPSLFDDMLSLVIPDVEMADVSSDVVLSPVSVADVESLLASEPSSPMSATPMDVPDTTPPPPDSVNKTPKRRPRARDVVHPYERKAATNEAKIHDRKLRKKEQNKVAALRYREKKRAENEVMCNEATSLETRNIELHDKVDRLEREVQYLKDLMVEVALVKSEAA